MRQDEASMRVGRPRLTAHRRWVTVMRNRPVMQGTARVATEWYYVDGEARVGPVSPEEMARLIARGRITPQSHVWRQGLPGWEEAGGHFAFGGVPDAPGRPSGTPPEIPDGKAGAGGMSPRAARYLRENPQPAPVGTQAWARPGATHTGPDGLYVGAPSRGFLEAISVCLRRYFTFSGRASRSEYWFFILFTVLLAFFTSFLDAALFGVAMSEDIAGPLNTLASLGVFVPTLAVGWRRLHDTGRSGWWIGGFILAVPAALFLMMSTAASAAFSPAALGNAVFLMGAMMVGFVIYCIVMLVFLVQRGDPGPNRFG